MEHVVLIIHLIVTLALIVLILLQRSEGGGLVNSSGGGLGAFASAQSTGNALTRMTAILATLFFITNLSLAIMARDHAGVGDVLEAVDAKAAPATPPVDTGVTGDDATDGNTKVPSDVSKGEALPDTKAGQKADDQADEKSTTDNKAPAAPLAD